MIFGLAQFRTGTYYSSSTIQYSKTMLQKNSSKNASKKFCQKICQKNFKKKFNKNHLKGVSPLKADKTATWFLEASPVQQADRGLKNSLHTSVIKGSEKEPNCLEKKVTSR